MSRHLQSEFTDMEEQGAVNIPGDLVAVQDVTTGNHKKQTRTNFFTGTQREFITTAVNLTLTALQSGAIVTVTATSKVVTLPATATGLWFTIVGDVANHALAISPNASDSIAGLGLTPADDKDLLATTASDAVGDFVTLYAVAAGWVIGESRGVFEIEA